MNDALTRRDTGSFDAQFEALFDAHFDRVFRVLDRLSGEPDLAADMAQDAFVRLYQRGSAPDRPEAWLISVAMNLFRNASKQRSLRRRLLSSARGASAHGDAPRSALSAMEANETAQRVRAALDCVPERERAMLILQAEGYRYREIAEALGLEQVSVGRLLARAKDALRAAYAARTRNAAIAMDGDGNAR